MRMSSVLCFDFDPVVAELYRELTAVGQLALLGQGLNQVMAVPAPAENRSKRLVLSPD